MAYRKQSSKQSRKHLSYKQINFVRSEYIDSKFMNFDKFGKSVQECFNANNLSNLVKDKLLVQQSKSNLQSDNSSVHSSVHSNVHSNIHNNKQNNVTDYWQTLANAYNVQIHEIQCKHLHYDADLDMEGYDAITFDTCIHIPYMPTIGLLITKLSNIHEQFDDTTIQQELEIAKAYELFLNTVYNQTWLNFYAQNFNDNFALYAGPNQLRLDMFCKFICAISDVIEMITGNLQLNEYENIFIKRTANILASFDDNVELCVTANNKHTRLVHHRNRNYCHLIVHKFHAYGGYKRHSSLTIACNAHDWQIMMLRFIFTTRRQTHISYLDCIITNLHAKLINYATNFDEAKFKLKRLNRACQIINYKQCHFRTFEHIKQNLRIGKSNKRQFISSAVNNDTYRHFDLFERLFAKPQIILHSYEQFKIEHSKYATLIRACINNKDDFDSLDDIDDYCKSKGLYYNFALHEQYDNMLNATTNKQPTTVIDIKNALANCYDIESANTLKVISLLCNTKSFKKTLRHSKQLENNFVLCNFCA